MNDGLALNLLYVYADQIRARVHYYEEGNVQLNTDWTTQKPVEIKGMDDVGELVGVVVDKVKEIEGKYLGSIGRS